MMMENQQLMNYHFLNQTVSFLPWKEIRCVSNRWQRAVTSIGQRLRKLTPQPSSASSNMYVACQLPLNIIVISFPHFKMRPPMSSHGYREGHMKEWGQNKIRVNNMLWKQGSWLISNPTWSLFLGTSDSPHLLPTRHCGGLNLASICLSSHFSSRTLASHIYSLDLHFLLCETIVITPTLPTKIFVMKIKWDNVCEKVLQTVWHHGNCTTPKTENHPMNFCYVNKNASDCSSHSENFKNSAPFPIPPIPFITSSEMAHSPSSFVCLE